MPESSEQAVLLTHSPDRPGLLRAIIDFISRHGGNIYEMQHCMDKDEKVTFVRVKWSMEKFSIPKEEFSGRFQEEVASEFDIKFDIFFTGKVLRMAVFVSKLPHCLSDIIYRLRVREWNVEVPVIISNHLNLKPVADRYGMDYYVFNDVENKKEEVEASQLELLADYKVDFIVLARYMQILSEDFVSHYKNRIINIHHSFLPAFPGARPYHNAYKRGVKIVGATSHYVTEDLDSGPIIEQDVIRVNYNDSIDDLVRKGEDLEKQVLSKAIWSHINREILIYKNRTIMFNK
ncbi:MAG: formyltetrahydrofolate deformylase [Candidatus Dadabacteria bacterium]|nr:formyltetrahydrofolate deformylase [Candidatus Dadabacteria bacterium]MXZ12822.1 formyltetrahydrofolate deformylase [Candidatus Dadabacteria bacterium]MYA47703.1 formyltetrahydrofolate deformylase [Candidatus Dadabacteria bacterium]MYC40090.1 formyltetrahydrofolate deformylase [Candidatus Dadabacteria bacterium]MYF48398.1 formyltetrahydrofolate deformylase [Candidatus Dadabacteria bacterium]